jgi:hypothetical protein
VPTGTGGQWRAYLTGEPTDLARLQRELSTGVVTVAEDDSGTYLQADEFEVCADADEVRAAADPLVVLLNGMASLSFGGHRRVALNGTIARGESKYLFMEDSFRLSDELSVVRIVADITAEGVVTNVDGTVPDSLTAIRRSPCRRCRTIGERYPGLVSRGLRMGWRRLSGGLRPGVAGAGARQYAGVHSISGAAGGSPR